MGASIAESDLDDDGEFSESHEINVTPFIDVILVLLIIFMVAAPLSTVDLPVDLPTTTATPQKKPDKPTYVTIKSDLAVAIGDDMVKRVDLISRLDAAAELQSGAAGFRPRRSSGAVRRSDRSAGNPAQGKLPDQADDARGRSRSGRPAACIRKSEALSDDPMVDLDIEQRPSRRLWVFAAIAALSMHVGCGALAIAHLQNADFDEGLGTSGVEIGLDVTSVKTEDADLPPGPNTDASMAAPELAAQQAVVKEIDLPKDIPTEAENADRVVTENDSRKPAEEEPEKAAVQTAASTPSRRRRSDRTTEAR